MIIQKRIAASILKCSPSRVFVDPEQLEEIKKAITRYDIRKLIDTGVIQGKQLMGHSRFWAREQKAQKRKSRRSGPGSRKAPASARLDPKKHWMARVRLQRDLIHRLKDTQKITVTDARALYNKSKGGYFRSLHHLKLFIKEQGLMK